MLMTFKALFQIFFWSFGQFLISHAILTVARFQPKGQTQPNDKAGSLSITLLISFSF